MEVNYSQGWFRAQKCSLQFLNTKEANKLHQKGKFYTALIGDKLSPNCFLEIRLEAGYIGVFFMDSYLRIYLEYIFKKADDKLFLSEVMVREFDKSSDVIIKTSQYLFNKQGKLIIIERDNIAKSEVKKESLDKVDISANMENIPIFGEYEDLIKLERIQKTISLLTL